MDQTLTLYSDNAATMQSFADRARKTRRNIHGKPAAFWAERADLYRRVASGDVQARAEVRASIARLRGIATR